MRAFQVVAMVVPLVVSLFSISTTAMDAHVTTEVLTRKVKIYQFMLPEKNKWTISHGSKKICTGGPYTNWYAESLTDCALPAGSYTITCCDTRASEGWSGGWVMVTGQNEKLCKNFDWGANKKCHTEKFEVVIPTPQPTPKPTPAPTPKPPKLIISVGGWNFYAVDTQSTLDTGVAHACSAAGYALPCAGPSGCEYNGGSCVLTSETGCGAPMATISKLVCGTWPSNCQALSGVFAYMGGKWGGASCGGGGGWCRTGKSNLPGKAFCALKQ